MFAFLSEKQQEKVNKEVEKRIVAEEKALAAEKAASTATT